MWLTWEGSSGCFDGADRLNRRHDGAASSVRGQRSVYNQPPPQQVAAGGKDQLQVYGQDFDLELDGQRLVEGRWTACEDALNEPRIVYGRARCAHSVQAKGTCRHAAAAAAGSWQTSTIDPGQGAQRSLQALFRTCYESEERRFNRTATCPYPRTHASDAHACRQLLQLPLQQCTGGS